MGLNVTFHVFLCPHDFVTDSTGKLRYSGGWILVSYHHHLHHLCSMEANTAQYLRAIHIQNSMRQERFVIELTSIICCGIKPPSSIDLTLVLLPLLSVVFRVPGNGHGSFPLLPLEDLHLSGLAYRL